MFYLFVMQSQITDIYEVIGASLVRKLTSFRQFNSPASKTICSRESSHESLSILVHSVPNLLSVLDHASRFLLF